MAAVNCDDDENKPLCGKMGVQGFPTLKLVIPSKKPGKPRVEDYRGARSAKAIVDAVVEKIPNHVKRVTDKDLEDWLAADKSTPKAMLFTEKGTTSALLRSLAIDFLGSINFGQIRNKESTAVEKFGIEKFPTFVLLPGGEQEPMVYNGELNKEDMAAFLSQVAEPNSASGQEKDKKSKAPKGTSTAAADDATETVSDDSEDKTEAGDSSSFRKSAPQAPPLPILMSSDDIHGLCLSPKSGTCVLVLTTPDPATPEFPSGTLEAFTSLAEIKHKYDARHAKIFPFYSVPGFVEDVSVLKDKLGLKFDHGVEIIAVNARRGWWRRYGSEVFGVVELEAWIDAIRLGEGEKQKLPERIVREEKEPEGESKQEETPESVAEEVPPSEPEQESKKPEPQPGPGRDEL